MVAIGSSIALCAVLAAPMVGSRVERFGMLGCERLRLVALNAFAVTNPDYVLDSGASDDTDDCKPPGEDLVLIEVGPRMAMGDPPNWFDEIRQDSSLEVSAPAIRPWRMTEILGVMGEDDPSYDRYGDTRSFLRTAGRDSELRFSAVQVVVYLDRPLPESSVTKIWPNPQVVLLSGARAGKPLAWESSIWCRFRGFDTCDSRRSPEPLVAEFRKWVSLLKPEDSPVLAEFGLSLAELQSSARQGLIHGFIAKNLPGILEKLVADPQVRAAYIVDIRPPQ